MTPAVLKRLLEAVRKAALPGPFSQGVKLAREGAVFAPQTKDGALSARVRSPGRTVASSVSLYPEDAEWTCDCGDDVDPCAHVCAAAIALSQAADKGTPLAAAEAGKRLRYRLERREGLLHVLRFVVAKDGTQEVLRGSLLDAGGRPKEGIEPTTEDLALDRLLASRREGQVPAEHQRDIFEYLGSAPDVRFGERAVKVSTETIPPRARVVDQGDGVALILERDPRISEVLVGGIALLGDSVHPLAETERTGPRLERLPHRRVFLRGELHKLVTEILPELEKRMPVDVQTRRLPRARGGPAPRIDFQLFQKPGHALSVLATLVYGDPPVARIEGERMVMLRGETPPLRDEVAERELAKRLRDELFLALGRMTDFDGGDAARFAQRLRAWKGDDGRGLVLRGRLAPELSLDGESFSLRFPLEGEDAENGEGKPREAEPAAVLRAYRDGVSLVPLLGGGFAPLPMDWLSRYGARVAELLAARKEDGTLQKAATFALAELCDALERPRPPSFERLAPLTEGFEGLPTTALPADLRATLRPYQQKGVDWLVFLRQAGLGAVLADDMGLGKTLETIAAVSGRTLVVCPRSVVFNWAAEIARFRPGLSVATYHGPKRALDAKADVTLTTYAILRMDAEQLAKTPWDVVVLDEAQAIKNPDSQVARAAYTLRGDFRVALSGTPVENRLDELWSLLHFTNPGLLGGRAEFDERFARPVALGEPGAAERLRRRIRPFVLRRRKAEVAPELPPRIDSVLQVELEPEERDVYDAVHAATKKEVLGRLAEGGSVLAALEALLRLRQAACHPALVPGQEGKSSAKVEALVEALTDAAADGHRALVFSQWTSLLDLLEPHLQKAEIGYLRLDGSTRDRAAVVQGFQAENGPTALLVSLKAGGTGLNLTAADHVFLMDPWWNPAVEDQAADRAHRIGQTRTVIVQRLVAKDTVEERILLLQEKKRAVAEAALGEGDAALGLTREDLVELLA